MSNTLTSKNDLQGSATTLAASSWLSTDQTLLCPPLVGSNSPTTPSTKCSSATSAITVGTSFASATAGNLPSGYATVSSTGSPVEAGVFKAGSGARSLGPLLRVDQRHVLTPHRRPGATPLLKPSVAPLRSATPASSSGKTHAMEGSRLHADPGSKFRAVLEGRCFIFAIGRVPFLDPNQICGSILQVFMT